MRVTNIEWDFDNIDKNAIPMDGFPKVIVVPDNIDENNVKTWLSNTLGYRIRKFCLDREDEENESLAGLSAKEKDIYYDLQDGKKLSCSDLDYLIYKFEVDHLEGNIFIIEFVGKYYAISLKEGSDYWTQPVEVEKYEYEKMVTITEWKPVSKEQEEEKER